MSFSPSPQPGCADFRRTLRHPNRRSVVKAGLLGAYGLSLANLLQGEANSYPTLPTIGRLHSVIILWMRGGPSHIDMWDPKPSAPMEIRGEFGTKQTSVPGIDLIDLLPLSARIMNKWSLVRSLHHHDAGHSSGDQICFTGYNAGPRPDDNLYPSCGAIVSKQLGHRSPKLPPYVMIPREVPGTGPAYLGVGHKAFETRADPADIGPFRLPNFSPPEGITLEQIGDRRRLLTSFDALRRDVDNFGQMEAADRFQRKAWDILTSPIARDAFDLDKETQATRDRYGMLPAYDPKAVDRCGCPNWSQRFLLARG